MSLPGVIPSSGDTQAQDVASSRVRRLLAWAVIFGFFLLFAGPGLLGDFTRDDLMNLHNYLQQGSWEILKGNICYWSSSYRPLGGVFYLSLYQWFGFDPLPFRAVCFFFLAVNLLLAYRFARALSSSREVALLAALLLSYHAWFVDLYYSSGTIYELLCFFFYFTAFLAYLSLARGQAGLPLKPTLVVSALYILALNSKEMAVTLPLFLLIYELLYRPPLLEASDFQSWLKRVAAPSVLALITLPYVIGKLTGEGSLMENPAYRLQISPGRFLDAFHLYLNALFYQDHFFRDANTVQLLIAMLAFAVWRRSRTMIFAWLFLLLSPLPFLFVQHYVAMFLYIPSAGWALFLASAFVELRHLLENLANRVTAGKASRFAAASSAALFMALAIALAVFHSRETPIPLENFKNHQPRVRDFARQLAEAQPEIPKGTRILFRDDPFPVGDDWSLLFLVRLLYHDLTLDVGRSRPGALPPAQGHYDLILNFRDGRLTTESGTGKHSLHGP
jgi:hypothetical protein